MTSPFHYTCNRYALPLPMNSDEKEITSANSRSLAMKTSFY